MDRSSHPPVVVDLARELTAAAGGADGAVWAVEGEDLDVNLVRLGAGGRVGEHRNDEVDVVIVVLAGAAVLTIDGAGHELGSHALVCVPRGATRSMTAGDDGVDYVTVHRRRHGLGIASGPKPPSRRR